MILEKHLGGHLNVTHIDTKILDYFIDSYKIKNFLDIGCGPGGMVELALSKGLNSLGIDGDYTLNLSDNFIIHDYTTGPLILNERYDLVWSCEFVEHVEEIYLDNFMKTFQSGNIVCMTYAPPGKKGHHHVNLKTESYWINIFKDYGFKFDKELTKKLRTISFMEREFFRDYGLVFHNEN